MWQPMHKKNLASYGEVLQVFIADPSDTASLPGGKWVFAES